MTEKNNEQGNKTLFVFDYDNTIAFGTDGMFCYIIDQFLGDGATETILENRHRAGVIEDFIVNGDNINGIKYDKEKIIECLKKFINESPLYRQLQELDDEEIKATLSKIEELSANFEKHQEFKNATSKQFRRYFMENIVAKISAYNNVYLHKLMPQKAFLTLLKKQKHIQMILS